MSAPEKIRKRVNVKDLDLELKILLEKIMKLEEENVEKDKKLNILENTIKGNQEKIVKLEKMLTENEAKKRNKDVIFDCKKCGECFSDKRDLKNHIKGNHSKEYKCKICEKVFCESWSLELHSKSHEEIVPFKCNTCSKQFYSNWRLSKHVLSHGEKGRFCHYFNNGKTCPYEEIGCKFKHEVSNNCRYDNLCHIRLCQFKHSPVSQVKQNDKEVNNRESCEGYNKYNENEQFDVDKEQHDKFRKYKEMDENEQFDVKEEICMNICWGGDHKCMDHEDDNKLLGVDVEKLRDDYNNSRKEKYQCEKCKYG